MEASEKKLFDIVVEEYKDEIRREAEIQGASNYTDIHMMGIDFSSIFFTKNYNHIKKFYSKHTKLMLEYGIDSKERYSLLFQDITTYLNNLMLISEGDTFYKKHSQYPSEFRIFSEWVDWYGLDQPTYNPDEEQNFAWINYRGQKIVDEWNKFKTEKGLKEY